MSRDVYLDANASEPLRPEARAAMQDALGLGPGNPSSGHEGGRRLRRVLADAREAVAALVGAHPQEVVLTSGATESNVLAIRGALAAAPAGRRGVVLSRAEHTSLLRLGERLAEEGVPVAWAPVRPKGHVDAARMASLCDGATAVASLVLAQSVTGALQPVAGLAVALRGAHVVLHTDATQAAGRVPVDASVLGADLISLSGHKFGAPAGIGALVVRNGAAWRNPNGAGSQELGRRAGTEAVLLAAGLAAAARAARADVDARMARDGAMRAAVLASVRDLGGTLITPPTRALPNTLLVWFQNCPGDALLAALDAEGVRISAGTACTSLARTPPEVLLAAGHARYVASGAVRISLAWSTTPADVETFAASLARVLPRVRAAFE